MAFHLSMIPIVICYLLFYFINNRKFNASFLASFLLVFLYSVVISLASNIFYKPSSFVVGIYYYITILILFFIMISCNKQVLKNVDGFISIGLLIIVLLGPIFDSDFTRYLGNIFIFFLFFVCSKPSINTIKIVTLSFLPYLVLANIYHIPTMIWPTS